MQKTDYRKEARELIKKGISVVPLKSDGSKLPKIQWKDYQSRFMLSWEIEQHCKCCGGLAGITGSLSRMVCIDFDLDKELDSQDFWADFNALIPVKLKKKFRINETRSLGKHIWLRVDGFNYPSRKITHRRMTIPEMYQAYQKKIEEKKDDPKFDLNQFETSLQNKPLKCVIETRFEGSYGVILHESYKHFYGDKLHTINYDEWVILENAMYQLDCGFKMWEPYTGSVESWKLISKYNDDTTPDMVTDMMCNTGMYSIYSTDRSGNILLKRDGSNSPFSCKVFADSGRIFDHGMSNIFTDNKDSHSPFELFCAVHNVDENEGLKMLEEIYGNNA